VADYQGLIRVGVQNLGQLNNLEDTLLGALNAATELEARLDSIGKKQRQNQARISGATRDLGAALNNVVQTDQGRNAKGQILPGASPAERFAAARRLKRAELTLKAEEKSSAELARARTLLAARLNRLQSRQEGLKPPILEAQTRLRQTLAGIGEGSRANLLTNRFRGRQAEFLRGGGGRELSDELQQQAKNVREAWDLATASGKKNLPLMQRLSAEMTGLVREQNEFNRARSGRSTGFEAARRGQERIDELAARPGVGQNRIARLRSQAEAVVTANSRSDIAGSREAARRMNASIMRYKRELDAAARELSQQRKAQVRSFNVAQGWRALTAEAQRLNAMPRALPSRAMLAERVAKTAGGVAPARLDELREREAKRLAAELKIAEGRPDRFRKRLSQEEKRRASLGIGAPSRIGGPVRRTGAIPMGGGADSGIMPKALPSAELLQQRVALSRQIQPTRLDQLQAQEQKRLAEDSKRAAGSVGRFAAALEREEKRRASLGIGAPSRIGGPVRRTGAIPMGGEGGRPGMFDQYRSPAGPGNRAGVAEFRAIQKRQPAPGFFQGNARKAIGEGLIGGAFPLLFGQGVAASAGGLAGGVLGGSIGGSFGFGLSLAGTAIGQAVETTRKNLSDLAASLDSPTDAIAALETSGFRVSSSLKLQVEQLQSVGRAYDAQTLVLQEAEKRLGVGSARELNALFGEQRKLDEQWSKIASTIQSQLLPALVGLTEGINLVLAAAGEPIGKSLLKTGSAVADPLGLNRLLFSELQKRGRKVAATEAGNRRALSPQEAFAAESTRISESRRIADQIQSAYREAFNLQRQAHDLQRDGAALNKEIADYTYNKQREILDLRQRVAEKEIENNRAAAQNRIDRGDLGARQAFAAVTGFEQQLLSNVRESMRARREGEADIEQSRKRLELAMAKLNRDSEDYKRTTAREIEDIERRKLSYVRSVEDYKMRVADYVRDRARESADLMRQAMAQGEVSSSAAGGSNASTVASSLANRLNLTPAQAAGVVGNFMRESGGGINPRINEGGAVGLPARKGGYGIAQWTGPRQDALIRFAGSAEKAGELGVQIDFLIKELRTSEAGALRSLRAAQTPEEAARVFDRDYERSGVKALGERQRNARQFFDSFRSGGMGNGAIGLTGATGVGTGAHLDVRWADGRPITAADADRFIRVAGQVPSSFGVTSGYGPRVAPVAGASTFHKGIDFGTPAGKPITLTGGARLVGSMTEAQSRGGGIVGIINTPMGQMKLLHLEKVLGGNMQGAAAGQISNVPAPQFNPAAIGATPAAAPLNAERLAVLARMTGSEKEAQRILEDSIRLKEQGVNLAQVEAILQNNQLPQLGQQGDALRKQIEARRQILNLSDNAAAVADVQAEGEARLAQLEKERADALAKVQKQYKGADLLKATKQINEQSSLGINIAKAEEKERLKIADLNNQLQGQERARAEILQLQEVRALALVEAAALERGELEAQNAERLKASSLYLQADSAQRIRLEQLTAETEELRKQNEFRRRINELSQDTRLAGAGLRAGFVGAPARAFEEGLKQFDGDVNQATELANRTKLLEDQQLTWGNLEKNIVDVSNAISGALTNGLVDIVGGARQIEDVGREMLNGIAGTFADAAQQQLTTLMQRQLGGMLGGAGGPLTKALGAGAEIAGPQALGAASLAASSQVVMFGMALQTLAGQMALSGAMGGGGMGGGGMGSLFSSAAPGLLGSVTQSFTPGIDFGGFLANGGTAHKGKGYVVGEHEPEFFFPGVTGRVVPKSDMEKAAALREQNESSGPIDIRYEATEIAGERYVTEQQFRRGMAETSKRAQSMTYAGMRQNKDVRDFVGI
jgi:murein DD-endopeptidase MepM/ murein hydrolase activator NlpD